MPKRSEFKLLKRAVDALEVEGKDAVFWDRDLAGFGVRVHPTGKKVYVVQSRGPGGPKRVTLGRHGDISTDEARKQAAAVIDRIKRGEEPKPGPPEAELTVAGLAERFMRVYAGAHCKPGTVEKYHSILENHVLRALGSMTVGQSRSSRDIGIAPPASRNAEDGEHRGRRALADVHAGGGVGADSAREQPVPGVAPLQDAPL